MDQEDAELEAAERVIVRLGGAAKTNGSAPSGKISQRDAVISALKLSSSPWFDDVTALREEVSKIYKREILSTTFQPLISTMTKEQVVVRHGPKIGLAERIKSQV